MAEILAADDPKAMPRAAHVLRGGGLVAFPTDTVYGVGCLAGDAQAIRKLFEVKGRGRDKAIAILLADPSDWMLVAQTIPESAALLARRFWPGALTLIVPRREDLPAILGPNPTVGVRIPDYALARDLVRAAGPLAVTSANRSGGLNPKTAADVEDEIGSGVELILDGGLSPGGEPSTVVDCTMEPPVWLRGGPISLADLRSVVPVRGPSSPR
ncbi:MAG: L-threonylcarbamoyladenylate synthase [Anaerolineales bacterium]